MLSRELQRLCVGSVSSTSLPKSSYLPGAAVREGQADHVAVVVQRTGVALGAVVAAGKHAVVGVVLHLQLAAEYVRGPANALGEVIAEMEMFAVAGPVLDHAGLETSPARKSAAISLRNE
ncbi:hypothetical protein D3C78_486650 [compost metagenome]